MTSFAIHSPDDGPLLQRLHDDLVKAGFQSDVIWNKAHSPEVDRYTWTLTTEATGLCFYSIRSDADEHRDLTPDNYNDILAEVIADAQPA